MSGVTGGWCVDRGGRVRFIKVATQIEPPSRVSQRSLRTGRGSSVRHGAHQARIVPCGAPFVGIRTAGNRPMSTNWRHAASGRAGLHTPPDRSESYTPPTRPTHPSSTCRTSHVPWPGSSVRGPPQKRRPRVPRPPYRRPLSSPPRRMARPTDLRVRRPQTVLATSLGHSGPSAAMSPRTSSAASPKFTRWQQAAFTASQRSHIETLLQGHHRSGDHGLLHQRHVPRAEASPLRRPWPETSTHQGRHGDAAVEAAR